MRHLTLFHCETRDGDQLHENQFQRFVVSRDPENKVRPVKSSILERIVAQAKDKPSNNSAAVLELTRMLIACLEKEAYEMYVAEVGPKISLIFYDDSVVSPDKVSVDFEQTKNLHYQKYCLFKFASFLDLLRPENIYWRSQAESESMRMVEQGLDHFQKVDLQGKAATLARWIQRPGPSAFSAKRDIRSQRIAQRHALLRSMEGSSAREVAQRLDEEGFQPHTRQYLSYVDYYQKNPASFHAWLSDDRSEARKKSKTSPL